MKKRKERGITLIALVITILVLLLLATISVAILTGENGVITKAKISQEETKKAEYKEALEIIRPGIQVERALDETMDSKKFMDRYEEEIRKDERFKESTITRKDNETIQVVTKEGYVYWITEDKVELVGKEGEDLPPDLQESDIEFIITPSEPTNQNVTVEIKTEIEGYTLQYSIDAKEWSDYKDKLTIEENGPIYARLRNEIGETGGYATGNVTNIDKLAPNAFTPTATTTTNSITLKGSTTDAAKTSAYASSGIKAYYYSKDNGTTWEPTNGTTATSHTFTGLTQNKSYSLKIKAVDNAGNETITNTVTKTTGKVTDLTGSNVTFTYTPTGWTNTSVSVAIKTTVTGYTLQYSTNGTSWTNYTKAITFTQNGAIYARLWDGTNSGGYATGNVTTIDKILPTVSLTPNGGTGYVMPTSGKATIKTTLQATDTGGSGLNTLQYAWSTSNTTEPTTWTNFTNGTIVTKNDITTAGNYYLWTKVTDKAENRAHTVKVSNAFIVEANTATTNTITLKPNTTSWTNGNVIVTATYGTNLTSNKTLTCTGTSGTDYTVTSTTKVEVKTNKETVTATAVDKAGNKVTKTLTITNIDKMPPKEFNFYPQEVGGTEIKNIKATSEDSESGILKYQYSKDGGITWQDHNEFLGLATKTSYYLQVRAFDKAGNIRYSPIRETPTATLNIRARNIREGAFDILVWGRGYSSVSCAVWSHNFGQDDLFWYPGTKINTNNEYTVSVNAVKNHTHRETGGYYLIHAYEGGTTTCLETLAIFVPGTKYIDGNNGAP